MTDGNSGNDDIVRKIEALMRQAESTQYEAERNAFMAKADQLILRYQIDQAQIFATSHRNETPIIREVWTDNPWEVSKGQLLAVIAKQYNCRPIQYHRSKGVGKRLRKLVGFTSDIDVTLVIWTSIQIQAFSQMERAWNEYEGYDHGKTWKVNFLDGFVYRLSGRFAEMKKENEKEIGGDLLPVLFDRKSQVDDYTDDAFPNLRKGSALQRRSSAAGMRAGGEAANRADIGLNRLGPRGQLGR